MCDKQKQTGCHRLRPGIGADRQGGCIPGGRCGKIPPPVVVGVVEQPVQVWLSCTDITRHLSFVRGTAFQQVWRARLEPDCVLAAGFVRNAMLLELSGTPSRDTEEGLAAARALFNLIVIPTEDDSLESDWYSALFFLLHGDQWGGIHIQRLLDRLTAGTGNNAPPCSTAPAKGASIPRGCGASEWPHQNNTNGGSTNGGNTND